jgi:hypothetical protein
LQLAGDLDALLDLCDRAGLSREPRQAQLRGTGLLARATPQMLRD